MMVMPPLSVVLLGLGGHGPIVASIDPFHLFGRGVHAPIPLDEGFRFSPEQTSPLLRTLV